jgi:hypothetical protein
MLFQITPRLLLIPLEVHPTSLLSHPSAKRMTQNHPLGSCAYSASPRNLTFVRHRIFDSDSLPGSEALLTRPSIRGVIFFAPNPTARPGST